MNYEAIIHDGRLGGRGGGEEEGAEPPAVGYCALTYSVVGGGRESISRTRNNNSDTRDIYFPNSGIHAVCIHHLLHLTDR